MEYTTVTTNAETGEVTVRAWTQEEIAAREARLASLVKISPITPRQVRLLLLQQGKLQDVEAMIAQQGEATKIAWQYASEFRRDDPLLVSLAANLGFSNVEIDQFFISAAKL